MGRHFIIVDDKHKDDGYRRDEMRRRMSGYRGDGVHMGDYRMDGYRGRDEYDEGYRTGYEDAWQDHKSYMEGEGFRRNTRYGI